jgi:hypothetical protein
LEIIDRATRDRISNVERVEYPEVENVSLKGSRGHCLQRDASALLGDGAQAFQLQFVGD